jgi:hypothetical protein
MPRYTMEIVAGVVVVLFMLLAVPLLPSFF